MTGLPKLPGTLADPFAGSPSVSADVSRMSTAKNLEAAGQKFEAVFTGMMLKSMRATHLAEDIFGSKAQDQFRDMWDSKTVEAMAVHTPLGIGKAMTAFLARNNPALSAAGEGTAAGTGTAAGDKPLLNADPPEQAP